MTKSPEGPGEESPISVSMEEFLSGAYRRILWIACGLSLAGAVAATVFAGWSSGLGLAVGALIACLNFVWLHHGAELMIQRMVEPAKHAASKLRLLLAFTARYAFVLAAAYVILKSYPRILGGFIVGLAFPILAAMSEGVYEAVVTSRNDQTPD